MGTSCKDVVVPSTPTLIYNEGLRKRSLGRTQVNCISFPRKFAQMVELSPSNKPDRLIGDFCSAGHAPISYCKFTASSLCKSGSARAPLDSQVMEARTPSIPQNERTICPLTAKYFSRKKFKIPPDQGERCGLAGPMPSEGDARQTFGNGTAIYW